MATLIRSGVSILNSVSRIAPLQASFDFSTPQEFKVKAHGIVQGWAARLSGSSFHVRMHRRGLKSELPSPEVERFLDDAVLSATAGLGRPSRIDFSDPDYVIDVETAGNRAGLSLWTRNELRRLPFLRVD